MSMEITASLVFLWGWGFSVGAVIARELPGSVAVDKTEERESVGSSSRRKMTGVGEQVSESLVA